MLWLSIVAHRIQRGPERDPERTAVFPFECAAFRIMKTDSPLQSVPLSRCLSDRVLCDVEERGTGNKRTSHMTSKGGNTYHWQSTSVSPKRDKSTGTPSSPSQPHRWALAVPPFVSHQEERRAWSLPNPSFSHSHNKPSLSLQWISLWKTRSVAHQVHQPGLSLSRVCL